MAFFGGIGGGVARDVLLNDIPSPLKDPAYLLVCLLMGLLGWRFIATPTRGRNGFARGRWPSSNLSRCHGLRSWARIRRSTMILGSSPAIIVGLIAPPREECSSTCFSGVTPEIVRPSEHIVTTALLASTVYTLLALQQKGSLISSRHADRGAGCVPVSSVRCSRTLAADRAARRARRRPTHVNYLTSEV